MADVQVLHAYRHLYRNGLRAVQYSKPARYSVRDKLRVAFREKGAKLEPTSLARTLQFLEAAARSRGLEHNIVRNLLLVHYWQHYFRPSWKTVHKSTASSVKKK
jgi:hypothetical protein